MARYQFNYSLFHNTKAPVIPVEFQGDGEWHKVWVYVDSGASFTVLHTFEARRLKVNLTKCKKFYVVAAGDKRIPVYLKQLKVRIGRSVFKAEVGFCQELGGAFNLLGRKDIFNRFKVCFDDKKETVTFMS